MLLTTGKFLKPRKAELGLAGRGRVLLPAGPHLLQAQQMDGQQTRHSLAAPLQVGAHVELKGGDVTRRFLGGRHSRRLLPRQQLRGVSITEVT